MDTKKVLIFVGGAIFALAVLIFVFYILFRGNTADTTPFSLKIWGTFDNESFYRDAIAGYKKLHPNATIDYREIDYGNYEQTLINAFAANSGPDIWLMHNTWLPKHADLIAPLPATAKDQSGNEFGLKQFQDQFVGVAKQDFVLNNQIYALPLYIDTLALYYNKDLLNTAGIAQPPRTWDDFNDAVAKLTMRDDKGNITQSAAAIGTARNINRSTDILTLLMLQSGVRMTKDDGSQATFSRSIGKDADGKEVNYGDVALQYYTDFANQAQANRYTWNDRQDYSMDAFINGKTAMMFNYAHQLAMIHERAPRLNFGVASMPQPTGASVKVDFANYWAPTVSKQSKNIDKAWDFLIYLSSAEGSLAYMRASDRPSARLDLIEQTKNVPDLSIFATQALTARSWLQVDNAAIETIFADLIDGVNINSEPIHNALISAENKVSALMRNYNNQ